MTFSGTAVFGNGGAPTTSTAQGRALRIPSELQLLNLVGGVTIPANLWLGRAGSDRLRRLRHCFSASALFFANGALLAPGRYWPEGLVADPCGGLQQAAPRRAAPIMRQLVQESSDNSRDKPA